MGRLSNLATISPLVNEVWCQSINLSAIGSWWALCARLKDLTFILKVMGAWRVLSRKMTYYEQIDSFRKSLWSLGRRKGLCNIEAERAIIRQKKKKNDEGLKSATQWRRRREPNIYVGRKIRLSGDGGRRGRVWNDWTVKSLGKWLCLQLGEYRGNKGS